MAAAVDVSNTTTASVDQNFLHADFFPEPFYYQANTPQNCCLPVAEFPALVVPEQAMGLCAGPFSEMSSQEILGCKVGEDGVETKAHYGYGTDQWAAAAAAATVVTAVTNPTNATTTATTTATGTCRAANSDSTIAGHIGGIVQGMGNGVASRPTVFINEVAFEVGSGLLNVREAFGEEAVLLHASGDHVPVDERGVTLHPLQRGASYYLV